MKQDVAGISMNYAMYLPIRPSGSSAGLGFASVEPLEAVAVQPEDIVIVVGIDLSKWDHTADEQWLPWLQHAVLRIAKHMEYDKYVPEQGMGVKK